MCFNSSSLLWRYRSCLYLFGRSRLPSRDLLEMSVQALLLNKLHLKHRLNPIAPLCSLEDKMGASREDSQGKAFIIGVINFQGFKRGQEIAPRPRLKVSIKNWWNIIWPHWCDICDWRLTADRFSSVARLRERGEAMAFCTLHPSKMSITHFSHKRCLPSGIVSLSLTNYSLRQKSQWSWISPFCQVNVDQNVSLTTVSHPEILIAIACFQ